MQETNNLESLQELIEIMALLRSESGCQWDRQQTPQSLKKHILEETYELLEAIDAGNPADICDELGDLLLQVVFQAQIFSEADLFNMGAVARSISEKLKRRHPHIFAGASHAGHEQRWEEIKQQERAAKGKSNQLAKRIPSQLPALKRCTKVAKKCLNPTADDSLQRLKQQLVALEDNYHNTNDVKQQLETAVAQILTEICKFSAATGLDPEDILRQQTTQLISEIDSQKEL
jgi:MazG family protein